MELKKNLGSLFPPSPSAEEALRGNLLQAGAVHPVALGEPPWHRTRSAGVDVDWNSPWWEGGGEQLARLVQIVSLGSP